MTGPNKPFPVCVQPFTASLLHGHTELIVCSLTSPPWFQPSVYPLHWSCGQYSQTTLAPQTQVLRWSSSFTKLTPGWACLPVSSSKVFRLFWALSRRSIKYRAYRSFGHMQCAHFLCLCLQLDSECTFSHSAITSNCRHHGKGISHTAGGWEAAGKDAFRTSGLLRARAW